MMEVTRTCPHLASLQDLLHVPEINRHTLPPDHFYLSGQMASGASCSWSLDANRAEVRPSYQTLTEFVGGGADLPRLVSTYRRILLYIFITDLIAKEISAFTVTLHCFLTSETYVNYRQRGCYL